MKRSGRKYPGVRTLGKSKSWISIIAIASMILFIVGCSTDSYQANSRLEYEDDAILEYSFPDVEIVSFISDRTDYSSQQDMDIKAEVSSSDDLNGVLAVIRGIRPYDHDHIYLVDHVDLSKGMNNLTFKARTPYCTSGCGGVVPGPYEISLELSDEERLLGIAVFTINLRS